MYRSFSCIILFYIILASFASAHDPIILHTTLDIVDDTILFQNNGSYSILVGENNYQNEIIKSILFQNDGMNCTYGNFSYRSHPSNGFNITITCPDRISKLFVEDKFMQGSIQVANKIYETHMDGEDKRFVGIDYVSFNINSSSTKNRSIFLTYYIFGIEHILFGFDHIVFIIGFLLIATSLFSAIKNISGFTLSHSFTLTLAATGILMISSRIVEPAIAISIVIVGLLGVFKKLDSHISGFWLIFTFGLFHGLGFAGAISEVGFPKTGFITSLIGFNLGVETGQLCIVVIAYPIFYLISRYNKKDYPITNMISASVAIAGAIWLIQRLF